MAPQAEVAAKALVEFRAAVPPAANSDEARIIAESQKIVSEQQNPLHVAAGKQALDEKGIKELGKANTTEQPARLAEVNAHAEILSAVAEGRVDALFAAGGANLNTTIQIVEAAIARNPTLWAQYDALGGGGPLIGGANADKETAIKSLLKDQITRNKVAELLTQQTSGTDKVLPNDVKAKEEQKKILEAKKKELEDKKKTLKTEKKKLEDEKKEYEVSTKTNPTPPPPTITKTGAYVKRMGELQVKAVPVEKAVAAYDERIEKISESIAKLEDKRSSILANPAVYTNTPIPKGATSTPAPMTVKQVLNDYDKQITDLKDEHEKLMIERAKNQKELAKVQSEIEAINTKKDGLAKAMEDNQAATDDTNTKLEETSTKLVDADAAVQKAKADRIHAENKFVSDLGGILDQAVTSTLANSTEEIVKAQLAVETAKAKEAKTAAETAAREAVTNRYRPAGAPAGSTDIDWNKFDTDWQTAMLNSTVGPEELLKIVVDGPPPPATNHIDELKKDPEAYKKFVADFTEKMSKMRLVRPRRSGIAKFLYGQQNWEPIGDKEGRDMAILLGEDFFKNGMAKNQKARELWNEAVGKDMAGGFKFGEVIKQLDGKGILTLIGMLLGVAGFLALK